MFARRQTPATRREVVGRGRGADATVHHDGGVGRLRSGWRDQAAFMSGVLRSRTWTPHDAWPGGRLQRARHGLAARKPGPPPRKRTGRPPPARRRRCGPGGLPAAPPRRGCKKRHCRRRVFEWGSRPPPPRRRAVGGSTTSAATGAQANPPARQTFREGGGGRGRVEAGEWQAAFRS